MRAVGLEIHPFEETKNKPILLLRLEECKFSDIIMKIYSSHGIYDFEICRRYKSYVIKKYFKNNFFHLKIL